MCLQKMWPVFTRISVSPYIELLLPLIKPFKNPEKNYINIYITIMSYIYSVLITTKIKNQFYIKK